MKHHWRKLVFPLALACICIFVGLWYATQNVAELLQYHPTLGPPMFVVGDTPIYAPKILYWWFLYGTQIPEAFDEAFKAIWVSLGIGAALGSIIVIGAFRQRKNATSQGTARWADREDILATGLLDNEGVVLGMTR